MNVTSVKCQSQMLFPDHDTIYEALPGEVQHTDEGVGQEETEGFSEEKLSLAHRRPVVRAATHEGGDCCQ